MTEGRQIIKELEKDMAVGLHQNDVIIKALIYIIDQLDEVPKKAYYYPHSL